MTDEQIKELASQYSKSCWDVYSDDEVIPMKDAVDFARAILAEAIPPGHGVWREEECHCWSEESVAGKELDYDVRTKEWIPIDCRNCKGTGFVPVERVEK